MDRAIKTVKEMITQREYNICDQDDEKLIGENKRDEKIIAFLQPVIKFNVDRFKEYVGKLEALNSDMDKREYTHCVIVYTDCITPMGKKMVFESPDMKFELFSIDELQFNITKHRLVPLHVKLDEKNAKKFKQKYGLKHQAILLSDPISRFYNYKRGDVIEIVRPNNLIAYRIVKG